jgi:hypothetical protein
VRRRSGEAKGRKEIQREIKSTIGDKGCKNKDK